MTGMFEKTEQGVMLRVRISPNSSSCSINGIFTDAEGTDYLKISVNAVPEKGKANKELIAYLAKYLKVAKSRFKIVSGETDRFKRICITADEDEVVEIETKLNEKGYNGNRE